MLSFIVFLHLNKAESIETQLNSRSSPKYFPKAGCLGKALAEQGGSVLSAVELCYLRFVAMFGSESRYCEMPVRFLAAAHAWHTGPGCATALRGLNLLYNPLPAWDILLCWPLLGSRRSLRSLYKHQYASAVLTMGQGQHLCPLQRPSVSHSLHL